MENIVEEINEVENIIEEINEPVLKYYFQYKNNEIVGYSNVPVTSDEITSQETTEEEYNAYLLNIEKHNQIKYQIESLKQNLKDTDYQAIKFAEGEISAEDYAPIKLQRKAWREEINNLEI